jgi:hypothetical protein
MAQTPSGFCSPSQGSLLSVFVSMASIVASGIPTPRVPMQSIWDDPLIVQTGANGWHCGYCGSSWAYVNSLWVFKHLLLPLYHAGKGINPCSHDLFKIPIHDKIRWVANQSQSSDQQTNVTTRQTQPCCS